MDDLRNPYIAGAPVVETSMFFGREDVFNWIERSLGGKYVDHILVLHGQRRVGKTSVLKQIPNFLPTQYIQVFFDLQGRTNTTLDRFLWWLAREIARTLKQERDISIPRPDRSHFRADPEYLLNAFLPSLKPKLGDHILLLTFDEFDTLDRSEIQETLARPLIETLRRLMEIDWLNFIFSIGSSGNKLENMQASYTDFFKSALYRKISFLTREDCNQLITRPVEGLIHYDPKAVSKIFEITSGHPYFTQLMCHELFSLCQKTSGRRIRPADVDSVLDDVIERGTVNLKFVWDEASDLEKWTLAGLARMVGDKRTAQDLGELLRQQRVRFSDSDLNAALIHLRDKDVITQDNRFIIHLMQMWLQANRPMDRVREELVEVNPIANRYIEIGDEYRDLGQTREALDSYQQALNVDPSNLKAQSSIALLHLENHAYQQAVQAFGRSLQIDDEDVVSRTGICEAHLALGDQARDGGKIEAAIEYFREILVINPAHTDARQRLADIHKAQAETHLSAGEDEQALSALKQAMDYTPEDDRLAAWHEEILTQKKAKEISEWLSKAERAVARQHWDEAAGFVEEAIKIDPDNTDLQSKRVEVKDAPRQQKIQAYKQEAEQALRRGNFDKAITAIETAAMLAPEDEALSEWLESTRSDQLNAQLTLFRDQANRAIAAGDWDNAISARKEALKLSPDDAGLQKALADTEASKHQAQLDLFQNQAGQAIQAENWDAAITALEGYLKLEPGETKVRVEIEEIREKKRHGQLAEFKSQAESTARAEHWEQAVTAWENYLALHPDDQAEAEERLQQVGKYAQMAADYADAQQALRKKRYRRGIELLQGIIAQDPTYKSTSRLLVEAVEANKAVPIWHRTWVPWVFGALLVVALGVIFGPQLWERVSTARQQNPVLTEEAITGVEQTHEPVVSPQPDLESTLADVLASIADKPPTFEEDFSTPKAYWSEVNLNWVPTLSEAVSEGVFNLKLQGQGDETYGDGIRLEEMRARDFVLQFDFTPGEVVDRAFIQVRWHLSGEDDGNQFRVFMDGYWDFILVKEDMEIEDTLAHGTKPALTHQAHTLQVISKDDQIGVYLNGELLLIQEVDTKVGDATDLTAHAMDTFQVEIDNLKFWNLDEGMADAQDDSQPQDVDLGNESSNLETQLPTPTDNFSSLEGNELPSEGETSSQPGNEIPRPANLLGKEQLFETAITSLDWSLPEDNSVETWVVATGGNQMLILDKQYNQYLYDETAQILSAHFENPGGGRGLTLGCDDGSLKYYTKLGRYWSKLYDLDVLEGRGAITSVQYGSSTSYQGGVEGGDGAAATDTGSLAVWNSLANTGTLIFRKEIDEGPVYSMDWGLENRLLLTTSKYQGLQVWNPATGGRLLQMDFKSLSAAWSPDGRYITLEDHSQSLMLVVLQSGVVKAQVLLPSETNQVAWSPDGRWIATAGTDGIIRLWSGSDEDGSIPTLELKREFRQDTEITTIAWSPDSKQLVAGDVEGYIWYWDLDK